MQGQEGVGQEFSYSLVAGLWTHLALRQDADNAKLYVNGVLDSIVNRITFGSDTAAHLLLGAMDTTPTNFFSGLIGLVHIYNRALGALEINNHFNREKHLFGVW